MDVCSSLTSHFEVYSFDRNISGFGGHFLVSGVSQAETPPGSAHQDLSFICPLFVNCLCVSLHVFSDVCSVSANVIHRQDVTSRWYRVCESVRISVCSVRTYGVRMDSSLNSWAWWTLELLWNAEGLVFTPFPQNWPSCGTCSLPHPNFCLGGQWCELTEFRYNIQ